MFMKDILVNYFLPIKEVKSSIDFEISSFHSYNIICMTIGKRSSLSGLVERKRHVRNTWGKLYANEDFPLRMTHKTTRDEMIPDIDLPEKILTESQ